MREVGLVKYCLALADRVTEDRCNKCWGEGAGDCSWHRKCKEDNLVDGVHMYRWRSMSAWREQAHHKGVLK